MDWRIMIDVEFYKNKDQALESLMKKDKEYVIVRHDFSANTKIRAHFHPNVDEWLIVNSGEFLASLDFGEQEFNINKTTVLHFPKSRIHSLRTLSKVSYTVLRESKDELIYLSDLIKNGKSIESVDDICGSIKVLYENKFMTIAYATINEKSNRHFHNRHDELYRIQKGIGYLHLGNNKHNFKMFKDASKYIHKNNMHYIENIGPMPLEILVITYPKYDTKDVIRK